MTRQTEGLNPAYAYDPTVAQAVGYGVAALDNPDMGLIGHDRVVNELFENLGWLGAIVDSSAPLDDNEVMMGNTGSRIRIGMPERFPQGAGVLGVLALIQIKAALTPSARVQRWDRLDAARRNLVTAGKWLELFSVGRQYEDKLVNGLRARALSGLGRITLAEGAGAKTGADRLQKAHYQYKRSNDKVGQVRNTMYTLINERAAGRIGDFGRNILHLGAGLSAATARGQWNAWRVAGRMVRHVLTPRTAQAALTDSRAV